MTKIIRISGKAAGLMWDDLVLLGELDSLPLEFYLIYDEQGCCVGWLNGGVLMPRMPR